ncbi:MULTISPECIES: hypothetical protein [Shewanella]|uniref:Toxin-antitoxin system YwqK family antitoxin n=1 Tax=Shewanella marisflavi TaxID=260364 RepID=A0ABX5WJZ9_9GAMM|nr:MULTISPECIES: hypothetical protein [Shewanella]QDF74883.1 hypothetical protein FGA12_06775 [Shewanella marisflavi]
MKSGVKLISPAFLALGLLLLSGCHQAPQLPIDEQLLTSIECSKQQIYGIWVETDCLTGYRGKPFSGIATRGELATYFGATQYLEGKRHGFSFSANGRRILSQGWYRQGIREGEHLDYYEQSQRAKRQAIYKNGEEQAIALFDEAGIIESYRRLEGDKTVESIIYEQGRPWTHIFFQDGEQRERLRHYFPDGSLASDALFRKQDLKLLSEITFYASGRVKTRYAYDSKSDLATQQTYWPNGRLQSQQQYGFDPLIVRHCEQRSFCQSSGALEELAHYEMGVEHGRFEWYHCSGQLMNAKEFRQGVMVDTLVKTFDDSSNLIKRELFDGKGKLLEAFYFNAANQQIYYERP